MIKALMLVVKPAWTWERICEARRGVLFLLVTYVLPLLVLTGGAEGYGLVTWGKYQGRIARLTTFDLGAAAIYEVGQLVLSLATIFIGAWLVKALGETFHGRHTFRQSFTVVAYGLAPLYLVRVLDMWPRVPFWLSWGIGVLLVAGVLYTGLPRIMEPDPPHAFGLYLMSVLFLVFISGLIRFVTAWYLQGEFPRLQSIVETLAGRLPF